jgi:hypothetical protein
MRYKLEVRIPPADVGQRVTIRWRPAELEGSSTWMTDVLGILEEADDQFSKPAAAVTHGDSRSFTGQPAARLTCTAAGPAGASTFFASRCSPAAVISSGTRR